LLLLAAWRLFGVIRCREVASAGPNPLPRGTMLKIALIPGLNLLVAYRVQKGPNSLWPRS